MAADSMAELSIDDKKKIPHLPDEILVEIFSNHQLPPAAEIARDRYEGLNIPKDPLIHDSPIKDYRDNDLHTGACTHEHGEYKAKLRTLSAISKSSRDFHKIVSPIMYAVYPGQTVIKPKLFLRSIKENLDLASFVKQMVIDPCDSMNSAKFVQANLDQIGLKQELISVLDRRAEKWNDEASATLLLLRCTAIESLAFTLPSFHNHDSGILNLFTKLWRIDSVLRANKSVKPEATTIELPLRKMNRLFIHHAEHMYVRNLRGAHALMRLSSVQSVTVYRFWDGATTLKGLQQLQSLTLWRSSFKSNELLKALNTCTGLGSLHIMIAGFKSILGKLCPEDDRLDMNELGKIIRMKLTNLRELRLDDRELDPSKPYVFPSLRRGPALEKLAINEAALGCYTGPRMPNLPLADMLPDTLQSVTIYRTNQWWHEADRHPHSHVFTDSDGITYRFDAIHDKIVDFMRNSHEKCPQLKIIYLDPPMKFGRSVKPFGWDLERVVGAEVLVRPSVVVGILVPPEEKEGWEKTHVQRAGKAAIVLKRI